MKNRMIGFFGVAVIVLTSVSAHAIVIGAGDITNPATDPSYSYDLTYADMVVYDNVTSNWVADQTTFDADFVHTNMEVFKPGPAAVRAVTGFTNAMATITFDFSSSGYAPTNVVFKDSIFLFSEAAGERVAGESMYSTDGSSWTTISSSTTTNGSVVNSGGVSVALNSPSTVYYRIQFDVLAGDSDGSFNQDANQWSRTGGGAQHFVADFDLIPEPASIGLLLTAGGVAVFLRRMRR